MRRRLEIGWEVAAAGGTISDMARRCKVQNTSLGKWLRHHAPDLHAKLLEAPPYNVLPRAARYERLVTVRDARAEGLSEAAVAARVGISTSRLRVWLSAWAPFGVEDAIELERIDDDEASDCEAA